MGTSQYSDGCFLVSSYLCPPACGTETDQKLLKLTISKDISNQIAQQGGEE